MGAQNWQFLNILGIQMFKGDDGILRFQINMFEFIKIRHDILILCH